MRLINHCRLITAAAIVTLALCKRSEKLRKTILGSHFCHSYVWIECHILTFAFENFRSRIVGCKSSSVIRIHIRIISDYIASSVHSVRGRIPSVSIFSCNNGRNKIDNFSPFLPTATLLAPRRLPSDSRRVSLSVSRLRSCSRFFCASRVCLCRCREAGGAMLHVITSFNMQRTLTNSI